MSPFHLRGDGGNLCGMQWGGWLDVDAFYAGLFRGQYKFKDVCAGCSLELGKLLRPDPVLPNCSSTHYWMQMRDHHRCRDCGVVTIHFLGTAGPELGQGIVALPKRPAVPPLAWLDEDLLCEDV